MIDAPGANHPPLDPALVSAYVNAGPVRVARSQWRMTASYGARGENLMTRS